MQIDRIQTSQHILALLALDVGAHMIEQFGLDATDATTDEILQQLLTAATQLLSPQASGIVLDPVYSFALAQSKPAQTGVLFRLEKLMAQVNPEAVPVLIGSWGVGAIKQNYGVAKIELYYHPKETHALEKKQLLCELSDYCRHEGVDLFCKLVVYTPAVEKFTVADFQQAQLQAVAELSRYCSLVALQYPQDALACATLTAELDIPWIVSSDDLGYDAFKDILRTAMNNGARGYLADAVLWQEMYDYKLDDGTPDWTKVTQFLQTTARDRSIELHRIATEVKTQNQD